MANVCVPQPPQAKAILTNPVHILKYVVTLAGSVRPSTGQMWPRNK